MTVATATSEPHRPGPRGAGDRPVVALLPWGDLIEDYLDPLGLSLDAFADDMTGGWLFGYVEALESAGWRVVLCCVSHTVRRPERRCHLPTGATLWVLPPSRLYRWLRGATASGALPARGRLHAMRERVLPYLATPPARLARVLRRERCRAVLCQEYESPRFDVCVGLGRFLRLPVVATFQGGDRHAGRIERALRPRTVRAAAGLVIAAEGEAARVQTAYGVPRDRIARIPNPLDLDAWEETDRRAARDLLGLPPEAVVAAWHGRVTLAAKGLDVLLDAWAAVERHDPARDVRLLVIGTGPDANAFRARADALGLRTLHWIDDFVLDRDRLRRLLGAADLYVFPSRHEGFAVAPLEAMASGLPVVAADASGIDDLLPHGEADGGLVVPRGDANALVAALERLLGDAPRRAALGRRARARARTASTEAVGQRLAAVLQAASEARP